MPLLLSKYLCVIEESKTSSALHGLRVCSGRYALRCSPVWFGLTKETMYLLLFVAFMCGVGGMRFATLLCGLV